ncbi:hypothetical protein Rs2_14619 [Raphanus sativus]|nr:Uncharacterized protein Rs2_42969 [Raphanus sativus]KAJ4900668.1 hypothetical protein Rs2_14619 [Raphanus sativus]
MSSTSCKDRRFRIRFFVSAINIPHLKVILKSSLTIYLECDLLHARRRWNIKGDLPSDLKTGRCSSTFQVRFLRFWEARNVRRGGKPMGVDMLLLDFQYRQLPRSTA